MPESGDLVHTVNPSHANYVGDGQECDPVAVFTTTGNAVAAPDADPGAGRIPAGRAGAPIRPAAGTYDFSAQVTQNLDLYAQWVRIEHGELQSERRHLRTA